jgi:hypothetical protein
MEMHPIIYHCVKSDVYDQCSGHIPASCTPMWTSHKATLYLHMNTHTVHMWDYMRRLRESRDGSHAAAKWTPDGTASGRHVGTGKWQHSAATLQFAWTAWTTSMAGTLLAICDRVLRHTWSPCRNRFVV